MKRGRLISLFAIVVVSVLSSYTAHAQKDKDNSWYKEGYKEWSDGPLTIADFSPRMLQDTATTLGEIRCGYPLSFIPSKDRNLHYTKIEVVARMDKIASWYNSGKNGDVELSLRYFQTIFDMLEIGRRQIVTAINDIDSDESPSDVYDYYVRLIESRINAFIAESEGGRNTEVLSKYEQQVKDELLTLPENAEVQAPKYDSIKKKCGIGLYMGYAEERFIGSLSNSIGAGRGIDFGFEIPIKKLIVDLDAIMMGAGRLLTDNFYTDTDEGYSWERGKKVTRGAAGIDVGYRVYDGQFVSVCPMAGVGVTFVDQKTGVEGKTSEIAGFRMKAGAVVNYKFRCGIDDEVYMNFKIFGARSLLKQFGGNYSINFGVTVGFNGFTIR